ncbi:MAG: ABC transporter substrate-binding protein [Anaerolineae bacterium]
MHRQADALRPRAPRRRARPDGRPAGAGLGACCRPDDARWWRAGTDEAAIQVAAQVNDGLFRYREDGSFDLAPGLAENWDGDVSGKIYTFTLRHGLLFADGTPLDAPAVKWNFERWLLPDHPAHKGRFLQWLSMFGAHDEKGIVEKVEALDADAASVPGRASRSPVQHLANPAFGIASPRAVTAQGESYGADGDHRLAGRRDQRLRLDKGSGVVRLGELRATGARRRRRRASCSPRSCTPIAAPRPPPGPSPAPRSRRRCR